MALEDGFDVPFATRLALREKQVQQSYRPVIGVHKWFARRPGSLFRSLLLAEFVPDEPLSVSYWKPHRLHGVIADPFMGGGTPVLEANRLGLHVVGVDINPMAWWIVRQSLQPLDPVAFTREADAVATDVERAVGDLYRTRCTQCGEDAGAKYFLWVKTARCPQCGEENDFFPGHLLAEAVRHPMYVLVCPHCGELDEHARQPTRAEPAPCGHCGGPVAVEGPASRGAMPCRRCGATVSCPAPGDAGPPHHRPWAIEYHCTRCRPGRPGRFFKKPDARDLAALEQARARLAARTDLPIPRDAIPAGDESDRLHRWGYRYYRQMFTDRQLLGLGLLLERIGAVPDGPVREALLTVFSDSLRYQNLLCRYDTYALKVQDIFSVHGFPVGLVQCENNLLGMAGVGSGSFRHFVRKYARAKQYCQQPFEIRPDGSRREPVPVPGERIEARLVDRLPRGTEPEAWLRAAPSATLELPPASLDAVYTDPPYFDNVQYAELMDFCHAWLRPALAGAHPEFRAASTRSPDELTGNVTEGRGLAHFTEGLSAVFCRYAAALKPGAPFVFTYHHNDPEAYLPLVVAILDAGLACTATLAAAGEMAASLHIAGTRSSVLDSVFVCRARGGRRARRLAPAAQGVLGYALADDLRRDVAALLAAGLRAGVGDLRCLAAGHVARLAINALGATWDAAAPLEERMRRARAELARVGSRMESAQVVEALAAAP